MKIAPDGTRTTLDYPGTWAIDGRGDIAAYSYNAADGLTTITTHPASGAASTTRRVRLGEYPSGTLADNGTLYFYVSSPDSSKSPGGYVRLAPTSSQPETIGNHKTYVSGAMAPNGDFYLAQSQGWCGNNSRDVSTCKAQKNVRSVLEYPADGSATRAILTFGLQNGGDLTLRVDGAGQIFAAGCSDKTLLQKYGRGGGQPVTITTSGFVGVPGDLTLR